MKRIFCNDKMMTELHDNKIYIIILFMHDIIIYILIY